MNQDYESHTRYYHLHHFIILPLAFFLFIWTVELTLEDPVNDWLYLLVGVLFILISFINRIYANRNQDRIIRLEMRLRYYQLTQVPFTEKENLLNIRQIVALRFASDEELLPLIDRAILNNLSSKEIKKSIHNWQGDFLRV
ncbi:hypothetical protein G9H61_10385 [Aquirufa ecclesiirivi]|uniref:ABC transporter permease n=1 Tax=Aquirufa ecclesiirivi TaxID=2715124 RepID=A0ABT4JIC3_9BACT|nr:DUF6526 family protein [Aquirufa ecclesiirivi]MCZ2471421.1 hypothetical protein [Aquirufa ecclesiirivi]MCZ2475857.1 hypothetical protein [Aquirufa ecclesiirivi]MDF0693123.1 DUF6526 family protein [Aquirufa ecclesiirivi]NHC49261.1 hypothetical protein [Aquirufa ecclesiirivi]